MIENQIHKLLKITRFLSIPTYFSCFDVGFHTTFERSKKVNCEVF